MKHGGFIVTIGQDSQPAPASLAPALPGQSAAVEQLDQRRESGDVVSLALKLAEGTQWPGGAVGALGGIIILAAVFGEEVKDRLTSAEFVAVLVVGALLALVGPLTVAYTTTGTRRALVEVADKQAQTAESEARAEEERRNLQATTRDL